MRAHPCRILTTSVQHLPITGRHRHGWLVGKNYTWLTNETPHAAVTAMLNILIYPNEMWAHSNWVLSTSAQHLPVTGRCQCGWLLVSYKQVILSQSFGCLRAGGQHSVFLAGYPRCCPPQSRDPFRKTIVVKKKSVTCQYSFDIVIIIT